MKSKKGIRVTNVFQKIFDESNGKTNKVRVDKSSEFSQKINEIMARKNGIEMCSTHTEGKSVVAERFIRILKNKIYKYMTSISKKMYHDKLDDIVNK